MTAVATLQLPGDLPPPDSLVRVGEGPLPAHAWDASLIQVPADEAEPLLQTLAQGLLAAPGAPVVLALWRCPPVAVVGVFDTGRHLRGCRCLRTLVALDQITTVLALDLACLDQHATGQLIRQRAA